MNVLSNDDIIAFLRFLPSNDSTRLTRLNKHIGSIISSNPKIFLKPRITLTVKQQESGYFGDTNCLGELFIKIGEKEIDAKVEPLNKIEFKSFSSDRCFLPFSINIWVLQFSKHVPQSDEIVGQKTGRKLVTFDDYVNWLFTKFDLENLVLVNGGPLTQKTAEILNESNCRCFTLQLQNRLFKKDQTSKEEDFLSVFNNHQKDLGVSTKLKFECLLFATSINDFNYIKRCCDIFTAIATNFITSSFLHTGYYLLSHLKHRLFTSGCLRFHFEHHSKTDSENAIFPELVKEAQAEGIEILGVKEDDYDKILQNPIKAVPMHLDFKDLSTQRILRINFSNDGKVLAVICEIL